MKKITIILLIFSALTLTTCKKLPELKVYELNLANENVAYSQTSAEITVDYEYPTKLQYVNVTMSRSNYFDYSFVARAEVKDSVLIANFVDLQTDKNYYYKFEYSNGVNVMTSDVHSFYLDAALVTLPTVITMEVHEVQGNSAVGGGEIIDDGGYYVTARGVCWATHRNPTIFDRCTTDGMGTGSYSSTMTDLEPNSVYYVRAYAINEKGTSYGTEYSFETVTGNGGGGNLPSVATAVISDITSATAVCGGTILSNNGMDIISSGICWSTNQNPTTNDFNTTDGSVSGSYTSNMINLTKNTHYYVRAYATTNAGTAYGEQYSFTTLAGGTGSTTPTGAINGLFTINSVGDQIWFSQGNLQYLASTGSWRFAEKQTDYIGSNNSNISATYNGWIDLFGWGTSGYEHGATSYQPYSTSQSTTTYKAYGSSIYNLYNQTGQADWGYNSIANGGHTENQWRTLTASEWYYIVNTRTTASGIRYAKAVVNGKGTILLPDNWSEATYALSNTNQANADFYSNVISTADWNTMEAAGAVFIPLIGYRYITDISFDGTYGYYWTSSASDSQHAYCVYFGDLSVAQQDNSYRYYGYGVRLVRDAD